MDSSMAFLVPSEIEYRMKLIGPTTLDQVMNQTSVSFLQDVLSLIPSLLLPNTQNLPSATTVLDTGYSYLPMLVMLSAAFTLGLVLSDSLFRDEDNNSFIDSSSMVLVQPPSVKDPIYQDIITNANLNVETNPWRLGYASDYYDDIVLGNEVYYDEYEHDPLIGGDDYLVTSGSSLQQNYQLPLSVESATKLDNKKLAFLPPKHGINGMNLIFSGGKPTTFQSYISKKIYMDTDVVKHKNFDFDGNTMEEKDKGTWAGSSEWVRHWIQ